MSKLKHLKELIDASLSRPARSKLSQDQFDVGGFIAPNNRHFLNNIGSMSEHYWECGSHAGSSLVSAVYRNYNLKSATGVDNFSLFSDGQDIRSVFYNNADRHIKGRYRMLERDYFSITEKDLVAPIDFYYFDGAHDYESQYKGITHYAPLLAEEAVIIVDDASWLDPNRGTMDGIRDSKLNVHYMMTLWSGIESDCSDRGWWNGYFVMLVNKK